MAHTKLYASHGAHERTRRESPTSGHERTAEKSQGQCQTLLVKQVPSCALSSMAAKVSSTESGFEGCGEEESHEEESIRLDRVSVASFDSLSGCGKVEGFIDKRRPVGLEANGTTFKSLDPCAWISRLSPIVGESPLCSIRKFHFRDSTRRQVFNRNRSILRAIWDKRCFPGTWMQSNQHIVL